MRLALYQPDIPQNTAAILRLAACLDVPVDIIEPCGFPLDDKRMRRVGLDYMENVQICVHQNWNNFLKKKPGRIILLTTQSTSPLTSFSFRAEDTLLMGRESAGVPKKTHANVDARVLIPIASGIRSLNVVTAAAIALSEGLRQTNGYPQLRAKDN
ncbi:MAG: rRNA methyltransferase [Rhodospirillaceae bacterium]|nr:rRNA methyltransferase [Rhodospirillaceae bacterium]|tara:strand:- start:448 stop:915 length:468 start_codon:yes stop_codon:yes gene_type:complete